MKKGEAKVGMKVVVVHSVSGQVYTIKEFYSPFVVKLVYDCEGVTYGGGVIDISLLKKVD